MKDIVSVVVVIMGEMKILKPIISNNGTENVKKWKNLSQNMSQEPCIRR